MIEMLSDNEAYREWLVVTQTVMVVTFKCLNMVKSCHKGYTSALPVVVVTTYNVTMQCHF